LLMIQELMAVRQRYLRYTGKGGSLSQEDISPQGIVSLHHPKRKGTMPVNIIPAFMLTVMFSR